MKILVVEDDAQAAAFLVKAFGEAGHNPMHAADGETGFDLAIAEEFDVLVVDRMMPKLRECATKSLVGMSIKPT